MPTEREAAFLRLVRENDTRIRRICRVYGYDPESRKDLQQEILYQLWRSMPSFAGASSPSTWLYRVALNTALAHARRRHGRVETALDIEQLDAELIASPLGNAEALFEMKEQSEQLLAAVARLDVVDQMIVTMYLDDRSHREIADVIGITETNVGVKLHRIKRALARTLSEEKV